MLQGVHGRKISIAVSATVGDTDIVAAQTDKWIYVHELIGDLAAAGTLSVIAINGAAAERILATFELGDGQGITEQDEPGEDNRPRFEFKPGEKVTLRVTGGTFKGSCHYSFGY